MSLIKRIGFYLIGFSLGLVFLAFFFKEKRTEFCYLPNCRVLKEIRSKELTFTPEIQLLIDNNTITLEDFKILFWKEILISQEVTPMQNLAKITW